VIIGLFAAVPFIHQGIFVEHRYLPHLDIFYWFLGGALYIIGATIYMLRIPERLVQNRFDIIVLNSKIITI
jgi:predicted membrane channel-forming protein YqfA (hemolysin III family)